MKLKLKMRDLFLLMAGVIGIVAFFMAFVSPLYQKGIEETHFSFSDVYFGANGLKGAWLSFVGFVLILISTVMFFVAAFSDLKYSKIFSVCSLIIITCGIILALLTVRLFSAANSLPHNILGLGIGPILGSVYATISALCVVYAVFFTKNE